MVSPIRVFAAVYVVAIKMMKLFVLLLAAVTVNGASAALRGITSVSF